MGYLRIGEYDNERYLKTTERTTYTVNEVMTEEEMKSGDANNNIHDNDYRVLVRICAIDVKNCLTQKLNVQNVSMNLFQMTRLLYVAFAKQCPLLPIVIPHN